MRENLKNWYRKISGPVLRLAKPVENAPKTENRLFAFFNFGIANLERKNETTKFKNENFKIYSYVFQNLTTFVQFQK